MPHSNGRTIRVKPMPNGKGDRNTNWQVTVAGKRTAGSPYQSKQRAIQVANSKARKGDDKYIHKYTGAIQNERTHGVRGPTGDYGD